MAGRNTGKAYLKTEQGPVAINRAARRAERSKKRRGKPHTSALKGVRMNDQGQMQYKRV